MAIVFLIGRIIISDTSERILRPIRNDSAVQQQLSSNILCQMRAISKLFLKRNRTTTPKTTRVGLI